MRLDLLLLLMVVIWGSNFSAVKYALRDFPEFSFNAMRLLVASSLFAGLIWRDARHRARRGTPAPPFTAGEWARVVLLGFVGHFLYQLCFMGGVARTSVANSSLIFGCTPVAVALMASAAGQERVTVPRLAGVVLSLAGLYVLLGHRASWSGASLVGDVLILLATLCWSAYSVLSGPLLQRHAPIVVTGLAMMIGCVLYTIVALPHLLRTDWAAISSTSWMLMSLSSVLALAVAYVIWYMGVQRIGSSRTAIYSNLTPIVAMVVAATWLGEPIGREQVLGAGAILSGVLITRLSGGTPPTPSEA